MSDVIQYQQPKPLQFATLTEYAAFGRMVAGTAYAPKEFRGKPEDCALAAIYGAEIGIGPLQALQNVAVVNGRPTVWGDTALALVRASGLCVGHVEGVEGEGDARAGYCEVARRGEPPQRRTFSVNDAKRAKLWGRTGPWSDYPDRMLQLRARGFALRDVFPDVLRGIVTREEAADYQVAPEPVTVRPVFRTPTVEAVEGEVVVNGMPVDEWAAHKAERDLVVKGRGLIERATSVGDLDVVRRRIEVRGEAGDLTANEVAELVALVQRRAEELIRAEEQASEVPS